MAIITSTFQSTITTATVTNTAGVAIKGTNTNDSAAAGFVGEVIVANPGAPVTPGSTGVTVNLTSVSLTAGDWAVEGSMGLTVAATTVLSNFIAGISKTSADFDSFVLGGFIDITFAAAAVAASTLYLPSGTRRISLSGTTTIYLVGQITYTTLSTTTWTVNSYLQARRLR